MVDFVLRILRKIDIYDQIIEFCSDFACDKIKIRSPPSPLLNSSPFPPNLNPFPLFNFYETYYLDLFWDDICDVCMTFGNDNDCSKKKKER